MTDDKTTMDDLEPKTETNPKPAPEVVIGPNQNIENARLALPKSKYKPDYFAPKYASYIWKEHAPNFIKFIIAMEAGQPDEMVALTDSAIQDLSGLISAFFCSARFLRIIKNRVSTYNDSQNHKNCYKIEILEKSVLKTTKRP